MPQLRRPAEIRELVCDDPARVTDPQLLALLLATGSKRRASERWTKKTWSAVALAEALYRAGGWHLVALVRSIVDGSIDLKRFGFGKYSGGRLVAAMELAERWYRGFDGDGVGTIRAGRLRDLSEEVFRLQADVTEGELIALLSGGYRSDVDGLERLFETFGGPRQLLDTLTPEKFVTFLDDGFGCFHQDLLARSRLIAGLELARRYRTQAKQAAPGVHSETLGLESVDLIRLLDPTSPLDRALRRGLIATLRSHPDLAQDFERLETLAKEAGVEDYERAFELHRSFRALLRSREWSHPSEIVGSRVPYRQLLAIGRSKADDRTPPPPELLEVLNRLERSEREAAARPAAAFAEALMELQISERGAERALEDARADFEARLRGESLPAERSRRPEDRHPRVRLARNTA